MLREEEMPTIGWLRFANFVIYHDLGNKVQNPLTKSVREREIEMLKKDAISAGNLKNNSRSPSPTWKRCVSTLPLTRQSEACVWNGIKN